jgi:glycosyltransferase involved in cell wall biosynthesis
MKKKILWFVNTSILPIKQISQPISAGWLFGAYQNIKDDDSIEISMAFPVNRKIKKLEGVVEDTFYYGFSTPIILKLFRIKSIERRLLKKAISSIIHRVDPDILHIYGTEFLHSRIAVECFGKPERTIIHIQGMVSVIAKHCTSGFPFWIKHLFVPSSVLRSTIYGQSRRFKKAGKDEVVAIQNTKYIMGRTEWDEACTKTINPSIEYIHCGETLRSSFYEDESKWDYDSCVKHSIYFSQSSSQVKGLHLVLPILPELIKRYPDAHLYVGGNSPIGDNSIKGFLRRSPLGFYLQHLIRKYKLKDYVTFLGAQNEQQVVQNLKKAHVFLSTSLIENSPNSVGEALVIGTPVVSSDVGGVKDFIEHGKNGFIYPVDEPYMIPYYVGRIFDDAEGAKDFSTLGRELGRRKYSAEENGKSLLSVYNSIVL